VGGAGDNRLSYGTGVVAMLAGDNRLSYGTEMVAMLTEAVCCEARLP
jgi:hypothetical protein